ncbi:MAG: 4Fe-4S binding protein, partial [Candidatus Bathyarchaeota archaeon]
IIAIGHENFIPVGHYHYGENDKIITQTDLEKLLQNDFSAKRIVMIQCVGSRDETHSYCSRVCCTEAIKNAIRIKQLHPNTEVNVLYRDICTYGLWESLYREARNLGVVFLRFDKDNLPEVNPKDLTIESYDPLLNAKVKLKADYLVLSTAITPPIDAEKLSKIFKVPLNANGFFLEAHMKLRPVDFATDGVFVCGTAHYPKMINESITQASAAASRACTILSKDHMESEGAVSIVDEEKCKGCGSCVEVCPYNAIELVSEEMLLEKESFSTRKASINPIVCKGCGSCAVACPVEAITPQHFSKRQIEASIKAVNLE